MNKTTRTLIAAVAALTLSGGAFAQANNTLATPTTKSPVAAATPDYGTPGITKSDSGVNTASPNASAQQSTPNSSTPGTTAFGVNNTLARPSVTSPAAQ
jgi:hypothetical protein